MWKQRIDDANKVFEEWERKFKCKQTSKYYEGFQHDSYPGNVNLNSNQKYTLNLVASTIDIKLAGFLFQKPSFTVTPRPGTCTDYDLDGAAKSSQLKEDFVNTVTHNPNINFVDHIKLSALDSFFYFGVIEVGVAKDYRNPQYEFPELKSDTDEDIDPGSDEDKVVEEKKISITEQLYVKRINPEHFRISADKKSFLNDAAWVGYYEFYPEKVLRKIKGVNWPEKTFSSDSVSTQDGFDILDDEHQSFPGAVKVWQIWDLVTKKWLLLLDSYMDEPLAEHPFDSLPIETLRWKLRRKGWYPKPPVFDWISPQDEINEARGQEQNARRKYTTKYQVLQDQVDQEEVDKFTSGGDGTVVLVKQANAISPIQNADVSASSQNALRIAGNDFNIISGTSSDARGAADRETATQTKVIDQRAQIRESFDQMQFEVFTGQIGAKIIEVASNELDAEAWAKITIPESTDFFAEFSSCRDVYEKVQTYKFKDGYDFSIICSTQNDTPQAQTQKKQAFLSFITIVSQYPVLASNPLLIREAAISVGYRDEKVISQMQKAAILAVQTKMNQQNQQQQAQNGMNANNTQMAQMGTPDSTQVANQLQEQMKQ